jgi:uroporphyrin-III C-methyltransferase
MTENVKNIQQPGSVALVGAGPGDPELLTLKALRFIEYADVVVYDNLVGRGILEMIPVGVERIYVGKKAARHVLPQEEISRLLLELARAGKRVVRLKGGDPFMFGRGGEEMETLVAAGVPVRVVPGITAALGAGAALGFPLTHRDHARSCVFVTGHLKEHHLELDWPALARPGQTLVFYMGVAGVDTIARELLGHGLSPETPTALIYKATLPEQALWLTTLERLPHTAAVNQVKPPALIVIGDVVRQAGAQEKR